MHQVVEVGVPAVGTGNRDGGTGPGPASIDSHHLTGRHACRLGRLTGTAQGDRGRNVASVIRLDADQASGRDKGERGACRSGAVEPDTLACERPEGRGEIPFVGAPVDDAGGVLTVQYVV